MPHATRTDLSGLRLPKENPLTGDWSGQEGLHPFWLIKRQAEGKGINCEMQMNKIDLCQILDFKDLMANGSKDLPVGGHAFHVQYPFIVNTAYIGKNIEIVLRWAPWVWKSVTKQAKPGQNAFDQIHQRECKRRKKE